MPNEFDYDQLRKIQLQLHGAMRRAGVRLNRMVGEEDRGDSYRTIVWLAASVGLAHAFIGAVIISIVLYSSHMEDDHAALFATAYHFLGVEAILSLSYINGWSTPMRRNHRRYVHAGLQFCAIPLAVIGTLAISVPRITESRTIHGLSGLLTLVLTGASWVLGLLSLVRRYQARFIHMIVGTTCFLTSSLCLCFGLIKDKFKIWAGQPVVISLVVFVIFYSFCIVYTSCMKFLQRYKLLLARYQNRH